MEILSVGCVKEKKSLRIIHTKIPSSEEVMMQECLGRVTNVGLIFEESGAGSPGLE